MHHMLKLLFHFTGCLVKHEKAVSGSCTKKSTVVHVTKHVHKPNALQVFFKPVPQVRKNKSFVRKS